jgi:hypothetical protein
LLLKQTWSNSSIGLNPLIQHYVAGRIYRWHIAYRSTVPLSSKSGRYAYASYQAYPLEITTMHSRSDKPHLETRLISFTSLYSDGSQVCRFCSTSKTASLRGQIVTCVEAFAAWMPIPSYSWSVPASIALDLVVWIDNDLTVSLPILNIAARCFAVLRQLHSVQRSPLHGRVHQLCRNPCVDTVGPLPCLPGRSA